MLANDLRRILFGNVCASVRAYCENTGPGNRNLKRVRLAKETAASRAGASRILFFALFVR